MKTPKIFTTVALALSLASGTAFADAHINGAVGARQALMTLYGFNVGILGGMAQGKIDYNAESAQKAAANLASLTKLDQSAMWPQGSDNFELGKATRAKPEIWSDFPGVVEKSMAVHAAALAMEAAAGGGLDALQGAIRPLGQACGACHKAYRAPKE